MLTMGILNSAYYIHCARDMWRSDCEGIPRTPYSQPQKPRRQHHRFVEPVVVDRSERPYVAIHTITTMHSLAAVLPPMENKVREWMKSRRIEPAGPRFWRYHVVTMEGTIEVDVGFPVARTVPEEGPIVCGVLPGGRYITTTYVGHPRSLVVATAKLLNWAKTRGIRLKSQADRWAGRVEWYHSDLATEPDITKWKTELAILTESA